MLTKEQEKQIEYKAKIARVTSSVVALYVVLFLALIFGLPVPESLGAYSVGALFARIISYMIGGDLL